MKRNQIVLIGLLLCFLETFSQDTINILNDYILNHGFDARGKEYVTVIVPGTPPEHKQPVAIPTRSAVLLNYVPAFDWSFGCSATSAAMAAGYYDNNGYVNMYTGPSNYGFMPMDNSIWGTVVINGETRAQCPLSATRNTVDGRNTNGHVDDYWIQTNNAGPDPFIVNGWTEHTHGDCTGDYMKTNQSTYNNIDGATTYAFYVDGSPLSATDPWEGSYGLKLFYESRGYNVIAYYSQYIYGWAGNTLGFTFNQFRQEINNGRPVLIQVEGHTMLGYGYDDSGSIVYLHDTWDYSSHTMVWGGTYSGMAHYGVSVVQLQPSSAGIVANFSADLNRQLINNTVNLYDWSYNNPTSWDWSISPSSFVFSGGTASSSQNPQVQFTAAGWYTVTLTASKSGDQDVETKTNYIEAVDCSNFAFPLSENFSEGTLPFCWQNLDNQGSGQVWHFDNPSGWVINTATAYNGFAMLDSDHYGDGGNQNADLVTPSLNLSDYSNITLSFQHHFRPWSGSSGTLSYSTNGGSTWTVIQTWTTDSGNPAIFNQVITAVAGQSNVKFKWNYTGSYGYYWAVDDISITGTLAGHWTGATSTSWTTGSNWSNGAAPSSTTNVTIPASAPNWPVYSGSITLGTQCGNITMNGSSQLTITGSLNIATGKVMNMTGNGLLKVRGNWTNNGTLHCGSGTVEFYGNSNGTLAGTAIPTFNNVIISKTSPYYFNFNVNVFVNNTFHVNPGAIFKVINGKLMTVQGTVNK